MDKDKDVIDSDSRDIVSSAKNTDTLLISVTPVTDSPEVLEEDPEIADTKNALT